MRARRTSGLLLAVAVSVALAVGGPSPAAAGPARSGPGPARSGPSGPSGPSGGQDWSLAGRPCRLIATATATVAAPAGAGACPGVRPGAVVLTPVGQCTLNFLWRGSDGRSYIGTAGHCLLEGADQTQVVFAPGDGPPARDSAGRRIGEFAYAALDDVSDFSLIRLDPTVAASPEICRFGGPTGFDAGPIPLLTPLQHVGQGSLTGSVLPARTLLAVDGGTRDLVGLGVASPGDSGSPVVGLDGRAVGVVVATGPTIALLPTGLFVFSVRIAPEMGRAGAAMGLAFDLVTAPRATGLPQP